MGPWIDAAGQSQTRVSAPPRIVSLVPSLTELLCTIGLADHLVGRTGFCVHPRAAVKAIPKVGGTKDVDLDAVRALAPTHVILNIDENRRETAEALREFVPHVVVTHPQAPRDNLALYRLLGGVFDRVEAAERLCDAFEAAYAAAVADGTHPARVLYLIWRKPWMTVSRDTYIARTLALFGWQTEPAAAAARYPEIDPADYVGRVDRVLLSSEPYAFRDRHRAEVAALVPGADVTLIDGKMTSWYGSRAIAGLRYLADYTHGRGPALVAG